MGNTFYFEWEVALQQWLQGMIDSEIGIAIVSFITMFGEELVMIAILGFLYWCYDKKFGKFVGLNILIGTVANPMLKNLAFRRRPYFDHAGIKILKPVDASADIYNIAAQGYSFPSGHTTNSTVTYTSLAMYKKNNKVLWVIAVVLPFLVGLSRVMLGAHYVTDVLCGWVVGTGLMLLFSYLQTHVKNENLLHLIVALCCLPGVFYCKTEDFFTGYGMLLGYCFAVPFEKKFVNFKETRDVWASFFRVVGGGVLYFALNKLLKLPFPEELLESATMPSFLIRTVRYAAIVFILIGVYPMLFDKFKKKEK